MVSVKKIVGAMDIYSTLGDNDSQSLSDVASTMEYSQSISGGSLRASCERTVFWTDGDASIQ